jgi:hypothetical protein
MWQDVVVTLVAAGAVAVLGWRWLRARASVASGACPSCDACGASKAEQHRAEPSQAAVAKPLILVRKEEMGRERFGPGGDYRF